jgi:hypothetical protein
MGDGEIKTPHNWRDKVIAAGTFPFGLGSVFPLTKIELVF